MELYSRGLARRPYKTFGLRSIMLPHALRTLHIGVEMPAEVVRNL